MKAGKPMHHTMLFTTPEELRRIADKMEKHFEKAKLGDSLIVETVQWDTDARIDICIDQDEFQARISG